jgi:hypothetical protein
MCSIRSASSFVAVMSNITPWTSSGLPSRSRTIADRSWIHTTLPSGRT